MREILIVTANRVGLTADIAELLSGREINIEDFSGEDIHGTAVITLIVDQYDRALQTLRDAGYDAITEDALVIRLPDEPGALAVVAKRFKEAGLDLRSIRILRRQGGSALVALAAERTEEVKALVREYLVGG